MWEFEYEASSQHDLAVTLDGYAKTGWELVSVVKDGGPFILFFKRQSITHPIPAFSTTQDTDRPIVKVMDGKDVVLESMV